MNIDMKRLLNKFETELNHLFDEKLTETELKRKAEAVREYDEKLNDEAFAETVREFCSYRRDVILSNIEAAAFIFAKKEIETL